ncbi:hypothetical protein A2U01_0058270, partial [Trifolium medium]|nr:hypothetical protein [Trifolium medium]
MAISEAIVNFREVQDSKEHKEEKQRGLSNSRGKANLPRPREMKLPLQGYE